MQDFLCQIERCCKQYHLITPITFPPEHPVEEVGRLLLCCLLKHQDLGNLESVFWIEWRWLLCIYSFSFWNPAHWTSQKQFISFIVTDCLILLSFEYSFLFINNKSVFLYRSCCPLSRWSICLGCRPGETEVPPQICDWCVSNGLPGQVFSDKSEQRPYKLSEKIYYIVSLSLENSLSRHI